MVFDDHKSKCVHEYMVLPRQEWTHADEKVIDVLQHLQHLEHPTNMTLLLQCEFC